MILLLNTIYLMRKSGKIIFNSPNERLPGLYYSISWWQTLNMSSCSWKSSHYCDGGKSRFKLCSHFHTTNCCVLVLQNVILDKFPPVCGGPFIYSKSCNELHAIHYKCRHVRIWYNVNLWQGNSVNGNFTANPFWQQFIWI